MNWQALKAITENGKRAVCESCALPLGDGGLKVPGLAGRFCNVLCVECGLFGNGRCRCCGAKTKNRFCSDVCRKRNEGFKEFGNGDRLLAYLREHFPALAAQVLDERRCKNCGGSLAGKRSDAEFCGDNCRVANSRKNSTENVEPEPTAA